MGGGEWTTRAFADYTTTTKGMSYDVNTMSISGNYSAQDMFKSRRIDEALNPKNVMRECCDSEEHPYTVPVILSLDVTGSMGQTAVEVAKKLNVIMTDLYGKVRDVEFLIMGIGDLAYDNYPLQVSQFESDIRIAEQLDKVYFEGGGGGNMYESYTAAWYFGARHTKLDCWKRNKKGIIITMGDETLNPYLPARNLCAVTGDTLQGDVETSDLYKEVIQKYDVYHLAVRTSTYKYYKDEIERSFKQYLDDEHFRVVSLDNIVSEITDIVVNAANHENSEIISGGASVNENGYITW